MAHDVRLLAVEDLPAAWELSRVAFGSERQPPPGWLEERPGRHGWGTFDGAGRLVAKAVDREQDHWFGGRPVPASGVAGVAVVPELRGTGLARRLLTTLLTAARERGAVISTLFPTNPAPYRRLGYEEVGALTWTSVPTSSLGGVSRPSEVSLRPAEAADVAAVLAIYRTVARAGTGLMERSGPLFDTTADAVLQGHDGFTVAERENGGIEGYASWDRGPGYDAAGRLSVPDLFGLTRPATEALLAMLGSWGSVAPTLRLRLPDPDPVTLLASLVGSRVESRDPWMLRVLDAPGAVSARGWPAQVDGSVDLLLEDVAVLYAGAGDPALLRRAGLLAGSTGSDGLLQVATAGPRPTLLDYF